MRRVRAAAAETAHAQATVRARDADLRDLEMQLSSLVLSKRGGGRSTHLRTAAAVMDGAADVQGGNDREQGCSDWVGRLSPRLGLGGWLNGGPESTSGPLTATMPDRCGPCAPPRAWQRLVCWSNVRLGSARRLDRAWHSVRVPLRCAPAASRMSPGSAACATMRGRCCRVRVSGAGVGWPGAPARTRTWPSGRVLYSCLSSRQRWRVSGELRVLSGRHIRGRRGESECSGAEPVSVDWCLLWSDGPLRQTWSGCAVQGRPAAADIAVHDGDVGGEPQRQAASRCGPRRGRGGAAAV